MATEPGQAVEEQKAIEQFQLAKEVLRRFYVLVRTARSYDRSNSAMVEGAQALCETIRNLLDECEAVRFDIVNDCVFFNRVRMRTKVSGFNTIHYFIEETKRRGIRSLEFDETAEVDDLVSFAMVFAQIDPALPEQFAEVRRLMELEGLAGISVKSIGQADLPANEIQQVPPKEDAKHSFFSALHLVKEAVHEGVASGRVNPRRVRRVVESVVDSILSDEESMMALTAIRDYDAYTYHHSLNVCIYSIALGNRLGLPKQILCQIGIAALFHDVGKTDVPRDVLNKIDNLTDNDWRTLQEHTMSGVKVLTYIKKVDRTILQAMVVAFCHHLNMDRSGYPQTESTVRPDAFSRIVRIADVYDALTSARSYRMRPFSRAEALTIITEKAGKELDPMLCAVFADVVGGLPDDLDVVHEIDTAGSPEAAAGVPGHSEPGGASETWDFPADDPMTDGAIEDSRSEEGFDPAEILPSDADEAGSDSPPNHS
jgi:HD-GYP domain-containing protein (c-di-GMP phosphodiesterase class II)